MNDPNWELVNGPPAHHIEQLNATNTINVLEGLVTLLIAHRTPQDNLPHMPNENALKELHRCGTLFLLQNPGTYRDSAVQVQDLATGAVIYQAPPPDQVPQLMTEFFAELTNLWQNGDALDAA